MPGFAVAYSRDQRFVADVTAAAAAYVTAAAAAAVVAVAVAAAAAVAFASSTAAALAAESSAAAAWAEPFDSVAHRNRLASTADSNAAFAEEGVAAADPLKKWCVT